MAYAIIRIRKLKTRAAMVAVARHNDRRAAPINADPERAVHTLVGTEDIVGDADTMMQAAGIDLNRLRKDSVLAVEAILTASPEFFRPGQDGHAGSWDPDRLDAWLAAALKFLKAEWGGRIVSITLHLDEATPHMHVVWIPIDEISRKRGPAVRLNAARWLDGTVKLRGLQDRYAAAMADLGIKRGVRGSRAHHRTVSRLYGAIQADSDAAALSKERAVEQEQQARTLLDHAERVYKQATELLPMLARSVLAAPIRRLGALLHTPVAQSGRQNQIVRE